ncbi:hypothetical protein [Ostreibacterium oceani]|uniref:Uncharacterized protein n=1 Tax=Ostreibacterium oceani TaxID=2654998 RepID=A0A6N7EY85_9GAMM|nr:hypothetical protein [Ostreibacterium oceani]MPV85438.1 hypothetical protein [Ostreibacterium oceani]
MLNIEKITYLKVGYFLLPTAVFLYDLIYVTDEFRFALTYITLFCLTAPLGIVAAKYLDNLTMLETLSSDHDIAQTILRLVFMCFIVAIGYIQWFIIIPKLWGAIFKLQFRPFNVIDHESTHVRIGAFFFLFVVFVLFAISALSY